MTDICLLLRDGAPLDAARRQLLFSLAQYMVRSDSEAMTFEINSSPLVLHLDTDFKVGRHGSAQGIIFHARIQGDGIPTEALFLAEYRPDWYAEHVEESPAGMPDHWKN